jgi:hypothetical protein
MEDCAAGMPGHRAACGVDVVGEVPESGKKELGRDGRAAPEAFAGGPTAGANPGGFARVENGFTSPIGNLAEVEQYFDEG